MVKLLVGVIAAPAWWLADTATGTDPLGSFAQYGLAGLLIGFVLWLYIDERKDHRALRQKVLDDVLPALIANSSQMRASAESNERMGLMVHDLAARAPDPVLLHDWSRTMTEVKHLIEAR